MMKFNGYDEEFKKQITPTILKNATFTFHQDTTTKAGSALNPAGYSNNQNSCLYKNKISLLNSNTNSKAKLKADSLSDIKIPLSRKYPTILTKRKKNVLTWKIKEKSKS